MKKAAAERLPLREAAEMRLSVFRYAACGKNGFGGRFALSGYLYDVSLE